MQTTTQSPLKQITKFKMSTPRKIIDKAAGNFYRFLAFARKRVSNLPCVGSLSLGRTCASGITEIQVKIRHHLDKGLVDLYFCVLHLSELLIRPPCVLRNLNHEVLFLPLFRIPNLISLPSIHLWPPGRSLPLPFPLMFLKTP